MPPQRSGRDRFFTRRFWTGLAEDRRLLVGSLLFAAAAILTYVLVRQLGVIP